MIGELPKSLTINGKKYEINADYRNILRICEAFNDSELTDHEKAYICMKRLYYDSDSISRSDLQEAVNMMRALYFLPLIRCWDVK